MKARPFMWSIKSNAVRSIHLGIFNRFPLAQVAEAVEDHDFKGWLKRRGENEACTALMIGQSSNGRGLFALRPILAGERLIKISRKLVITPDRLHYRLKDHLQESISDCAKLALLILSEQCAGQASEWHPYMKCLPQCGALHNTILWSEEELEFLRQSSGTFRQSMEYRTKIHEEFAAIQQVFINYGKYGNDALATMFGFTLESNPYDQVEFWIGPSENDVLWKLRSELLQSHGMPILRRDGVSNDTGSYFVIKKVRNIMGQGKGIPQSLRAFARVLCADSKEELIYLERMASEGDGRLAREAFKDKRKELQAMLLLLTHLNALIEDYISALSDYEDRKRELISVRQEMVNNILEGELTILHSAADWLRHHCLGLDSLS